MSLSSYGNIRPADVSSADMDVILLYTPSRDFVGDPIISKITASDIITPILHNTQTGGSPNEILGGMYNLTLPSETFKDKGIYNLYIKPAEIRTKIADCGVLSSDPTVKGLIFDINNFPSEFLNKFVNTGLVGYRLEYLNDDGSKVQNSFKIITSAFLCEPINQNLSNSTQKAIRYRYNDVGTLLFVTLTPTSAPSNKPNAIPFFGQPNQNVIITNTYFDPLNIEIEMVDYDTESIAIGIFGDSTRTVDDGVVTYYNFEGEIYSQYNVFETKNTLGEPLVEVKRKRNNVDFTKSIINLIGDIGT